MKRVIFISLAIVSFLVVYFLVSIMEINDNRLHVIICDVGQGDSALIRTPDGIYILIDGGPDDSILSCLSNNLPFWQRTIGLVILSHPHYDHFVGLISVIQRYNLTSFASEKLGNPVAAFQEFENTLTHKLLKPTYLYKGDTFKIGKEVVINILSPTKESLERTSPNAKITDSKEFTNLVSELKYKEVSFLFTGDSQAMFLEDAIKNTGFGKILVLQSPHHGSRFGLTDSILNTLNPGLAYISVGKNTYGHPAPSTIKLLQDKNLQPLRTDRNGSIEFITDGKTLSYKTER